MNMSIEDKGLGFVPLWCDEILSRKRGRSTCFPRHEVAIDRYKDERVF